ncbi:MAG: PAS domain-containing protein [Eubacteriales bacterium]|nr:PAS domain-containing protein [Eubacteriales bacterium]
MRALDSYRLLTDGLADYLGPCYEIVLHSLQDLNNSVLTIHNGHFTGRKVGSPVTDLALKMLHDIENNSEKDYISYYTHTKDNKPMKSTTIAIRGHQNRIIGLLCINMYLGCSIADFMGNLLGDGFNVNRGVLTEDFASDVANVFETSLSTVRAEVMQDQSITLSNKNKEIIYRLYHKGIFGLKDSVCYVAQALGISKNTVYLHLRGIHKQQAASE